MPVHVGYFRMPWWMWVGAPLLIWGLVDIAWKAMQSGYDLQTIPVTRRTAGLGDLLETIPPPVLAAILSAGAVALLVGFLLIASAVVLRKPSFKIDARGVTSFSLLQERSRFVAWQEIQRLQIVQKAAILHGGRTFDGKINRVGIALDRRPDRDALFAALGHFRPDLGA